MESAILPYFIVDNDIVNSCNFIADKITNGTTYYEVIRIIDGIPIFLEDHLERFLCHDVCSVIKGRLSVTDIIARIHKLIEINNISVGNIRFQICTNTTTGTTFSTWVIPAFYPSPQMYIEGVKLSLINAERQSPNKKIHNSNLKERVGHLLQNQKTYEAILTDSNNNITEGSRSNVFFTKNNNLYTAQSSKVLKGITREKVIELANQNSIRISEKDINIAELCNYDGAFLTGTSPKILPISMIGNCSYNPENSIIKTLIKLYDNCIDNYISEHTSINSLSI